ncbi:acetyltransferase [Fusobacterium varium]|uniref:acetyltransferase n=1 Tax=Fusobacterium varium TaxID=856 RepID=UPI002FF28ADF
MKEKIILVGSGQHARVVLYNIKEQNKYKVIGFLDSDEKKRGNLYEGIPVLGTYNNLEDIKEKYKTNKFFIAFGDMKNRKKIFEYFIENNWETINIIHPKAIISNDAKLGKGILIECGCLITPNPIIGNNIVINTGSQVNHDNVVNDHVYIASGVILSGGVEIGENTLIDDGVVITLGKKIGKNCIIGAGAVVTKNIADNTIAFGNPSKIIRENK